MLLTICKFCRKEFYTDSYLGPHCSTCIKHSISCKVCNRTADTIEEKNKYCNELCDKCIIIKEKLHKYDLKYTGLAHKDYKLRVTYNVHRFHKQAYASDDESVDEDETDVEITYPLFIKICNDDLCLGRYLEDECKYRYLYEIIDCHPLIYTIRKAKVIKTSDLIDLS